MSSHADTERKQRCSSTLSLASVLDVGGWSKSIPPSTLPLGKIAGFRCAGGCVGPIAGLEECREVKIFCHYRASKPKPPGP